MDAEAIEPTRVLSLRTLAPLAPYIAVVLGILVLSSAWAALIIYQVLMCAVLSAERQWWRVRDLGRSNRPWIVLVAAALTSLSGVILYLVGPLGLTLDVTGRAAQLGLSGTRWLPFIACIAITNPWLEEVYWRGYLGVSSGSATWVDLWFAGYHVVLLVGFVSLWWSVPALVVLTLVAWAWRILDGRSEGLMVSAASHFAADMSVMFGVWALAMR